MFLPNGARLAILTVNRPPGTGKTFLGIALAKVLLASRPAGSGRKPILVVCLTNHALDSFLAGLRDSGIENLVRIGGGSREEWTNKINLREKVRHERFGDETFRGKKRADREKQSLFTELDSYCKGLNDEARTGRTSWHSIDAVLESNFPNTHRQLVATKDTPYAQTFAFNYWAEGGDLRNISDLQEELSTALQRISAKRRAQNHNLKDDAAAILNDYATKATSESQKTGDRSVWTLTKNERSDHVHQWSTLVDPNTLAEKFTTLHIQSMEAESKVRSLLNERDIIVLKKANVIGITTTACAARWHLFRQLDLEIMICEEAGEVLEAHTLCALFPTLQHAIFIGDPLQLRPEVTQQSMTLETSVGSKYRLDESLFERVMTPSDPDAFQLPVSMLSVQRRMHPAIADIARLTYPHLVDHLDTLNHPSTIGVSHRMFWFDHRVPESGSTEQTKSHINEFEADMVLGLATYLIKSNLYAFGEIAVLTPYSGQLVTLYKKFASTCTLWLSEKDRDILLDEGLLTKNEDESERGQEEVALNSAVRLATVDNFQGEEAKVIILTTVRSGGKPGFLRTLNRINVACSRARAGFYIFGNSETLSKVPMWQAVISVFRQRNDIGPVLELHCERHPETHQVSVSHSKDFVNMSECTSTCDTLLDCGHLCPEACHSRELHERIPCRAPCLKTLACGHKCAKMCYESCGDCKVSIGTRTLLCGHEIAATCSGADETCKVILERVIHKCGHAVERACSNKGRIIFCHNTCAVTLSCGHDCQATCGDCSAAERHRVCTEHCNSQLPCGHSCTSSCHYGSSCSPCEQPCLKRCPHGPCGKPCRFLCDPCVKPRVQACEHEHDSTICCLPSVVPPCNRLCSRSLPCGHICTSLCPEVCPKSTECPECVAHTTDQGVAVIIPTCHHMLPVAHGDRAGLSNLYNIDEAGNITGPRRNCREAANMPVCWCGASCSGIHRYDNIEKFNTMSDTVDKLVAKVARKLDFVSCLLAKNQRQLQETRESFLDEIRPNPLAARANRKQIAGRGNGLLELQRTVISFRGEYISDSQGQILLTLPDEVVDPIAKSLSDLASASPDRVPTYNLPFHVRFDLIEYRARSAWILETLKIAADIQKKEDPSFELKRYATALASFARDESEYCIQFCEASALQLPHSCPAIEATLLLQREQFKLLLAHAKRMSGETSGTFQLELNLDRAQQLCKDRPTLLAAFQSSIESFERGIPSLLNIDLDGIPQAFAILSRQTEKAYGTHVLGDLKICPNGHPYAGESFVHGCPECCELVERADDTYKAASKFLREADFLAAMKVKRGK